MIKKYLCKLLSVLMVMSVALCGCSKDGESSVSEGSTKRQETEIAIDSSEQGESSDSEGFEVTDEGGTTETAEAESYAFEYNPYVISSDYWEVYGEEFIELFNDFVTAYLNYETSIHCPDIERADQLINTLGTSFMLFRTDAYVDYDNYYVEEKQEFIWHYTVNSMEEHQKAIKEFEEVVAGYIEPCLKEGDNEIIRSIELYRELSHRMTYDYEAAEDETAMHDVTPINALVNEVGICQSFAGAYVHLLLQTGIDANTCGGLTYDLSAAHEWCIVTLAGKDYYVDPTYENGETWGLGLKYFGMTTEERTAAGDYDPESISVGMTNLIFNHDLDVGDTRFEAFRNCDFFDVDREREVVICHDSDTGEAWEVSVAERK